MASVAKSKIEISVVIPAYNAEKSIAGCLESILSQKTRKNYEVIVVDDGSRDSTAQVIRQLQKTHGNLRLKTQKNSGPAVARNKGARIAHGRIIVFVDSDCVAESQWLEEMVKPFSEKNIAGVQGTYRSGQKELPARLTQLEIQARHEKMGEQKYIDAMGSYSAAYNKEIFFGAGRFDESFPIASGEDTDLAFKISKSGKKMVFAPKAVVWHAHPNTWKKYFKVKYFRAYWRTKVYKKHAEKIVKDSYTSQTMKFQIALFYLALLSIPFIALRGYFAYFTGAVLGLLLLSSVPFAVWASKYDLVVALVALAAIPARTVFFGVGLVAGIIRELNP